MVYSSIVGPYSVYLHIPFCAHRCGYCDFNTYAGLNTLLPDYVSALCAEIEFLATSVDTRLPVHTIFFGGGTPSLLSPIALERIFRTLHTSFDLLPGAEISLEANPGSLSLPYLHTLHILGVNRLSLGMQSAHPGELRLLERQHGYENVIQSVTWARKAGFNNLNLDLIFGLPYQTLQTWQRSLNLAIDLHPEHFALYALTIEPDTPFGRWTSRGLLPEPDPDLEAEMYTWASEQLEQIGYAQYEISNWASYKPAYRQDKKNVSVFFACRHNLQYWRCLPYLAFGAGAHGFAAGKRTANLLSPAAYIQCLRTHAEPMPFPQTPATQVIQSIDRATEIGETMMMGLRLTQEGISAQAFQDRFGVTLDDTYGSAIERLIDLGLLEWAWAATPTEQKQGFGADCGPHPRNPMRGKEDSKHKVLRLTPTGRLLGNQVFVEFV